MGDKLSPITLAAAKKSSGGGGKSGHYDGELVICGKIGNSRNQVVVSYFETPYSMPSGFLTNASGEASTLQTPTATVMIAAQEYAYNSRFKVIAKRKGKFHLYGTSKGLDDVVVDAEIGDVIIQDVWVGPNVQATIDNPNYYLLQDNINNIMYDALVIRYEET